MANFKLSRYQLQIKGYFNNASAIPINPERGDAYIALFTANGWIQDHVYRQYKTSFQHLPPEDNDRVYLLDGRRFLRWDAVLSTWVVGNSSPLVEEDMIICGDLTIGCAAPAVDYTLTFDGESNDGIITWMEDEDYFQFSDDVLLNGTERLYLFGTNQSIYSTAADNITFTISTTLAAAAFSFIEDGTEDLNINMNNGGAWTVLQFAHGASNIGILPGAPGDLYVFESSASGENKELRIYGYPTGASSNDYGALQIVNTTSDFQISSDTGDVIIDAASGNVHILDDLTVDGGLIFANEDSIGTDSGGLIVTSERLTTSNDLFVMGDLTVDGAINYSLNQIGDVEAGDPQDGEILYWSGDSGKAFWTPGTAQMTNTYPLSTYIGSNAKTTEENIHGDLLSLTTGAVLNTVAPINVTTGIGKVILVVNAGIDSVGLVTVTGTTVDRNTGNETAGDTDILTINGLSTDTSGVDGGGNTTHGLSNAYITSKWFKGAITLSTAIPDNVTLSNVDVYHCSFEQFNDSENNVIQTLDINAFTTNANATIYAHAYRLQVAGDTCTIDKCTSIELSGVTANRYYRLRRGNLNASFDGRTDGFWVDLFLGIANGHIEDLTLKLWVDQTKDVDII